MITDLFAEYDRRDTSLGIYMELDIFKSFIRNAKAVEYIT